jgi:hypothetical protein
MEVARDIVLFGNKDDFAIQLGLHVNPEKCKLCLRVQGKKMGSFTKGGELKYSVKAYEKFAQGQESYYDSVFDKLTPTEIRKYFVDEMFALGKSNKKEKVDEYEYRQRFLLFWGIQFSNDGSFMKMLYKDENVIVVYEPPKKNADKYVTSFLGFCEVFEEYIDYCRDNNLI